DEGEEPHAEAARIGEDDTHRRARAEGHQDGAHGLVGVQRDARRARLTGALTALDPDGRRHHAIRADRLAATRAGHAGLDLGMIGAGGRRSYTWVDAGHGLRV